MSLIRTLSNALSGMATAQQALAVTANNVANANTAGYSRKVAEQEAWIVAGDGAGARSRDVARIADQFLIAEARDQASRSGRSSAIADIHGRIQASVFGEASDSATGLSGGIATLLTSLDNLVDGPEQTANRLAVTGKLQDLLASLRTSADKVQTIRADTDQQIGQVVGAINGQLAELAAVNAQFARGNGSAELEDRRDQLVASLAGQIDVQVTANQDGSVGLTTRAGIPLVDAKARVLTYQPASSAAVGSSFGAITVYEAQDIDAATGQAKAGATGDVLVSSGVRSVLTPELVAAGAEPIVSTLRGGTLQGLVEARDRVLPELADQLVELASLVRYTLNKAHNDAAAVPPAATLTGTRTGQTLTDPLAGTGTATIAVIDQATGTTSTAFKIDLAGVATLGDLVSAINAGAGGALTAALDADGRVVLQATGTGQGIAIAEGTSAIAVTDTAGHARDYGLSHHLGLNDLVVPSSGAATDLVLRADIAGNPQALATARLDVGTGLPVTATLGGTGDDRGAQALATALRSPVATIARGMLPAYSVSVSGYAADITSLSAAAAAQATSTKEGDAATSTDLATRIGTISGVNMDEELSRLILYQQAYTVSARIVSITDQLFDELLKIGN